MSEKWFLLIVNDQYYPRSGTGDWCGTYATYEEAKAQAMESLKFDIDRSYTIVYLKDYVK